MSFNAAPRSCGPMATPGGRSLMLLSVLVLGAASAPAQGTRFLRRPDGEPRQRRVRVRRRSVGGGSRGRQRAPDSRAHRPRKPIRTSRRMARYIAYTATIAGNTDVYVVPTAGGEARSGSRVIPAATSCADGRRMGSAWCSRRAAARCPTPGANSFFRLWTVAARRRNAGAVADAARIHRHVFHRRQAHRLPAARVAIFAQWWAEPQSSQWRRYRGGRTQPIRILNLADFSEEKLPWTNSNDTDPMWVGNTIYFLSDRDRHGQPLLVRARHEAADAAHAQRRLRHLSASAGPDAIVYEQAGYVHSWISRRGSRIS